MKKIKEINQLINKNNNKKSNKTGLKENFISCQRIIAV